MLKVLDLFSGIGGFSLGLERTGGFETVAFCEIDPFCQKVLKKHWPDVPIFNDVRTLNYDGAVDVITGGYPCQPFSQAGKRKGKEDDRHLWPDMFNLIKKHRPSWVIGENVAGHISMGIDDVLADLENKKYSVRTFIIPACAAAAPHRRDRVWIIANAESEQNIGVQQRRIFEHADAETIADTSNIGCEGSFRETVSRKSREPRQPERGSSFWDNGWPVSSPRICGVDDGIPQRTHRLKSLGNAVVPQIPEIIGHAILEAEQWGHPHRPTSGEDNLK